MAIDDNASYELTGAQVKDLANKIKAKAADNIFVGATSAAPGSKGLVPQPQAGDDTKFLSGDGTWKTAGGSAVETVGSGNNICYKFPDGLMIACVRVDTTYSVESWSGWYESQAINPPNFAQAFIATPFCTASIVSTNAQCVIGSGTGHSGSSSAVTATRGQTVIVCRPNDVGGNISIVWQAIGRWK